MDFRALTVQQAHKIGSFDLYCVSDSWYFLEQTLLSLTRMPTTSLWETNSKARKRSGWSQHPPSIHMTMKLVPLPVVLPCSSGYAILQSVLCFAQSACIRSGSAMITVYVVALVIVRAWNTGCKSVFDFARMMRDCSSYGTYRTDRQAVSLMPLLGVAGYIELWVSQLVCCQGMPHGNVDYTRGRTAPSQIATHCKMLVPSSSRRFSARLSLTKVLKWGCPQRLKIQVLRLILQRTHLHPILVQIITVQ